MKKIAAFLFLTIVAVSCYTDEDQKRLQQECNSLSRQKVYLGEQVNRLNDRTYELRQEINQLTKERNYLNGTGREPRYIVKFKIKQGTFTIDIFEHVKNEMNSIEIEVPVNKDFYNKLSIGQDITDKFKWGSLVMDGDFSTLHMKVVGKRIE